MRDVMYVACVLGFSLPCLVLLCSFIVAHYLEKKMRKLFTQHLVIKSFSLSHHWMMIMMVDGK